MKKRDPVPPVSELLEDEDSPNVTKRKLVVEITKEYNDELAERIAQAKSAGEAAEKDQPLTQKQVFAVIQKTLDHILQAVASNEKVELRNFGVFEVKTRKARVGRNPKAPAVDVPIPQRSVVKFKPGKEMRAAVLKLTEPPPQPPQP
jgi:nucleoid DNA-binding protein